MDDVERKRLRFINDGSDGTLRMEEYNPEWAVTGAELVEQISSIFDKAVSVNHVGSTAIKGMLAKPIIDIAIGVEDFDDILPYVDELEKIGIIYDGEVIPGGRELHKNNPETGLRAVNVHVCYKDERRLLDYISIVEYCNAFEDSRDAYNLLKRALLLRYRTRPEMYGPAKRKFIEDLNKDAYEWYLEQHKDK